MASGIPFLGAPIMAVLVRRYQNYRPLLIWVGWVLCITGLVAGSFADTLGALIVTQGIMYGSKYPQTLSRIASLHISKSRWLLLAGYLSIYYAVVSMVNEWWIARRGMAFGIILSAAGASGIAMPLIIDSLLDHYGHRTSLRAISVAMVLLTGPLVPLMRPRLPSSASNSTIPKTNWSFVSRPLFWVYCLANIAQGLGFFFPSLFLPSYATSIGLSTQQGAILLALMSGAQVLGQWTFGILSDRMGLNILVVISTLVAAVASFTSWGLAHGLAPLVVFALLFGFFAYGFCSMRARMGMGVSEEPQAALMVFGVFASCQGVGNVLTGPISAALLTGGIERGVYGILRYRNMVLFTGGCMMLSALSIGAWYARPRRLRA